MKMENYPKDPHGYTKTFLHIIDDWIQQHTRVKYVGLNSFTRHDAILGTTHALDELHHLHGNNITVYQGYLIQFFIQNKNATNTIPTTSVLYTFTSNTVTTSTMRIPFGITY
jgi:hypothetical protein